jgi:drug/metabolite transporter (DMT)-like permease
MSQTPAAASPAPGPALLALALGALGIAFAAVLAKRAVLVDIVPGGEMLSPVAVAFWRMALAAPFFWGAVLWRDGWRREPAALRLLIVPGAFFALDLGLWHWAFEYTSVANATLEANFAVVLVAAVSWWRFGERLTRTYWVGAVLALAGMTQLVGASFALGGEQWKGDSLGLATACAYAGYQLTTKSLLGRFPVRRVMAWTCVVCAGFLLAGALVTPGRIVPATREGWSQVLLLALVSQVAGQGLIAFGLQRLPASVAAAILILQPLFTAILGWIILGQALTPWQMGAGLVVLAGIYLTRRGTRKS